MKKGRRIKTLHQLSKAATERRSVIVMNMSRKRLPAAVVMNWQATQVLKAIDGGMFLNIPKRRVDLSKPPRKWIPRPKEFYAPAPPILNLPYYPDQGGEA